MTQTQEPPAVTPTQVPWWERDPARLDVERAAVAAVGGRIVAEVPGEATLLWELSWPDGPDVLPLLVVFGSAYPWLPPEVSCEQAPARMVRHRDPHSGGLCLTAHGSDYDPTTLLADLLRAQLGKVRAANQPGFDDPSVEEPVGNVPRNWQREALGVVFAGPPPPPDVDAGLLTVREAGQYTAQWWVTGLIGPDGARHWIRLPQMMGMSDEEVLVPWVRLPEPLHPPVDVAALWAQIASDLPAVQPEEGVKPANRLQLAAVYAPGEVGYRQTGWQLHMLTRCRSDARRRWAYGLGLVEPGGRTDLAARSPHGTDLAARTVLVAGLGAIGHRIALDLARVGVGHLRLIDHDLVTAGTTSRQLPLSLVGVSKTSAVTAIAHDHNPYARISWDRHAIGSSAAPDVRTLIDGADLVIDATANPPVTRYLAHAATAAHVPFLTAAATAGGRGGHSLRLPAAGGGCYACAEHHRADGGLPAPPEQEGAWITPPGCSHPTYLGYGHDLAIIATQATRLAIAQLTGAEPACDVWTANIPDDGSPPMWTADLLTPHSACPVCTTTSQRIQR